MSRLVLKKFSKKQFGGDTDINIELSKESIVQDMKAPIENKKISAKLGLTLYRIGADNIEVEGDTVRIILENDAVVGAKFFIMDQQK